MGPGFRYVAEMVFSLGFGYAFLAQVRFYHSATIVAPCRRPLYLGPCWDHVVHRNFVFFGRHQNAQIKLQGDA